MLSQYLTPGPEQQFNHAGRKVERYPEQNPPVEDVDDALAGPEPHPRCQEVEVDIEGTLKASDNQEPHEGGYHEG